METNEISEHEVRAFAVFRTSGWMTNKQLAEQARIGQRTARAYTKKWTELGIADIAEVFPGHRYRLSELADKRNAAYMKRLDAAASVFAE